MENKFVAISDPVSAMSLKIPCIWHGNVCSNWIDELPKHMCVIDLSSTILRFLWSFVRQVIEKLFSEGKKCKSPSLV